ncbi:hypothetical protein BGC07_06340 [Piscirickettsia litoralis]|uniref:Uncharacterized protein n=1 Tax=Piscirickettsia litoralis TaxID=1891921 RepID=A0ABX3A291_9GAMM|nr:hypothetical protein [Piscirickettsia litoralis]ODN42615.1 hypothetical protein BGC07_06340 [Piscirickettsia litoralis]
MIITKFKLILTMLGVMPALLIFFDQTLALKNIIQLLTASGKIIISHPLGGHFVKELHQQDPVTVPHTLPDTLKQAQQLVQNLPLEVTQFINKSQLYVLVYQKK